MASSHSPVPAPVDVRQPSDAHSDSHGSLQALADDPATRDYLKSMLRFPPDSLGTSAKRTEFLAALLGSEEYAHEAYDDVPLLRQLEARVSILLKEYDASFAAIDQYDADALIAVLALIANRWPVLLDAMERANATAFVIRLMDRFSEEDFVIARCLTALRAFSVTDVMRKRIMFDGGMDKTLRAMSFYRTEKRIQDRAVGVIANVAFGCTHRKRRIARQGAVRKIIDGMGTFPNDENVQLRGALTIRNLTHDAQVNQYIAGNEAAVEAISSTLLRFRGSAINPGLRFQCVLALESLCHDDDQNRQRLVDIDNLAMVEVQNVVPSNESLHRFEYVDEENINEDGDVIVDDEEFLVPDISMSFTHGAALLPGQPSSKLITTLSGAGSVCSERTTQSVVLDERKLNIGNENELKERKPGSKFKPNEKRSIIRAIIHAVRREPDDPLLLEAAFSLLLSLALKGAEMQERIGYLGGLYVAIAAIRRHENSPELVAKVCALIRCLCLHEENRNRIGSGLQVLISAVKVHCKDTEVVAEVGSALSNAVYDHEKNRSYVTRKGGIDAIVSAMNACGSASDVIVLEASICALRNFVDTSSSGAIYAANEGAVKAAKVALDLTKDAKSTGQRIVQEQAVLLLVDLAQLAPHTTVEMIEIEVVDWVENALGKLSMAIYPELHASGDKLINMLDVSNRGKVNGKHRTYHHPSSSTSGHRRTFARGLFSTFSRSRRSRPKGKQSRRWRPGLRSAGTSEGDLASMARRFSSRLGRI